MAAEVVSASKAAHVTVYDRMPSIGRKFLMAGRGGLNLTHSEPYERFVTRYGDAPPPLRAALDALPPEAMRKWSEQLGEPTFVGSSGRVFPKSFKASPLLRAWLRRLSDAGVEFEMRHRWQGWSPEGALMFDAPAGSATVEADAVVLALGGASWPKLGSDGAWTDILSNAGIALHPLRPANGGFSVHWSEIFKDRCAGQPLKRVALTFAGETVRGEAMMTRDGIEGGAIYAVSARLRDAIEKDGAAVLTIALRSDIPAAKLTERLSAPRGKQSFSNFLRKTVNLSPVEIALLNEAAANAQVKLSAMAPDALADFINTVPVRLTGMAGLARAISTAGGVAFAGVDGQLMLRNRPGVFAAGEMLDWEAPTGGYLLQASIATGAAAGRSALAWLSRDATKTG